MSRLYDKKPVFLSQRVYRRLLVLYPENHRREYGGLMAQHFDDLCHDAWRKAQGWGLAELWMRTAVDLAKTSLTEHLNNVQQGKPMFQLMRGISTPRKAFVALFGIVFVLVLCASVAVTLLMPEVYSSTVRFRVQSSDAAGAQAGGPQHMLLGSHDPMFWQGQIEVIRSDYVLGKVVRNLRLTELEGRPPLSEAEAIQLLRNRLIINRVQNTRLIEVRVFSAMPDEASTIANELASVYRETENARLDSKLALAGWRTVEIVDRAVPGLRPARPNRPLNIILGIFGGGLIALTVGGLGALAVMLSRRTPRPPLTAG